MENQIAKIKASENVAHDLALITYPGQDPMRRVYRSGYEQILNEMPVLHDSDPDLQMKVEMTKSMMQIFGNKLRGEDWVKEPIDENSFVRTILALEPAQIRPDGTLKEGTELVLAKWGSGHTSPVHGHADGYLHEDILVGKMLVNTYTIVDPKKRIVRPSITSIVQDGIFASLYSKQHKEMRKNLVHNFTSIGYSATLHYLPEHTRDGRDNGYSVEHFEDVVGLNKNDVMRITSQEGMYLQKGNVVLVRSENVPEFGDHFIVVTGPPILKDHGMRVQEEVIQAKKENSLLDEFEMQTGLILLMLKEDAQKKFHEFHGIKIQNDQVLFS